MYKLKVVIITMGLNRIVKPICNSYNVVGIIESESRLKNKYNFLIKIYQFLFSWRSKTLKKYSNKQNIPYFCLNKETQHLLKHWVQGIEPDVIVVYAMSQLLKEDVFSIPKYGTINLHPSLLPKYRGPNPWFWNYYHFETISGVTLHFIDKGEDTGDIIYQQQYDIYPGMKSVEMQNLAIGKIGISLIFKALNNIEFLPKIKQPKDSTTKRARNLKVSEHQEIINWEGWSIERIWHILRGTEMWLNAIEKPKGIYLGQRWSVYEYELCNTTKYKISKIYKEKNKYFVACKEGKIYLDIKFSLKILILNF